MFGALFPNPSVDEINLLSNTSLNDAKLTITTINGQIVYEQANITLDKNQSIKINVDLSKGVYIVNINENAKVFSPKKL